MPCLLSVCFHNLPFVVFCLGASCCLVGYVVCFPYCVDVFVCFCVGLFGFLLFVVVFVCLLLFVFVGFGWNVLFCFCFFVLFGSCFVVCVWLSVRFHCLPLLLFFWFGRGSVVFVRLCCLVSLLMFKSCFSCTVCFVFVVLCGVICSVLSSVFVGFGYCYVFCFCCLFGLIV